MKTNINIKICAAVLLMMGLLPMLSSCDNEAVENSGNQRKIVFSSVWAKSLPVERLLQTWAEASR